MTVTTFDVLTASGRPRVSLTVSGHSGHRPTGPVSPDAPAVTVTAAGGVLTFTGPGVTEAAGVITLTGTNVSEANGIVTIA